MNAVDALPLPQLLEETALRWRIAGTACPECHGALYTHQALGTIGLGFDRCPECHLNFVQKDAIMRTDRFAEQLLDRAARETPLISRPQPTSAKFNPATGATDPCEQPRPYIG